MNRAALLSVLAASACVERVDGAAPTESSTSAASTSAASTSSTTLEASDGVDGSTTEMMPDRPPPPEGGLGPWGFGYVLLEIEAQWVATADFDGNGTTDMFALGPDQIGRVMAGDGQGAFVEISQLTMPSGSDLWRVGDFDGDGDVDVAAFDGYHDLEFPLALNDGSGTFAGPSTIPFDGFFGFGVTPMRLDEDADDDLFVPQGHSEPNLLAIAQGDGTFAIGPTVEPFGCFVGSAAAGDLDGDGLDDLVHSGACNGPPGNIPLVVLLNAGGTLATHQIIQSDAGMLAEFSELRLLDVDRDGHLDAVTGLEDGLMLATGDGTGTLGEPTRLTHDYPGIIRQVVPIELTPEDTRGFLISSQEDLELPSAALVTLDLPTLTTSTDPLDLQGALAGADDFDGDGNPDPIVMVSEPGGTVGIWLSGG